MAGTLPRTERLSADSAGLARAGALLAAGGLVAFPTETVYGLGADARNGRAVARIFAAKGRPAFNPLIVHVPGLEEARELAHFNDAALALARAFWPGPLTLVLPIRKGAGLSPLVSAGLDSVAIRVPGLALARDLLARAGGPVAAPSANPSGRISPTCADHVLAGLEGRIDAVLDGGPAPVGLESTIIGFDPHPVLLRPGGLAVEEVTRVLGAPPEAHQGGVNAPGQLGSHYAPAAPMRLNVQVPRPGERLLGFGPVSGPVEAVLNLSPTGNLEEAAANLFGHLHRLDRAGDAPIAVSPIPEAGLGRAINDRLRRAAAPRGSGAPAVG